MTIFQARRLRDNHDIQGGALGGMRAHGVEAYNRMWILTCVFTQVTTTHLAITMNRVITMIRVCIAHHHTMAIFHGWRLRVLSAERSAWHWGDTYSQATTMSTAIQIAMTAVLRRGRHHHQHWWTSSHP